ncbi:hypothetical protein F4861DRAFT_548191 [Xylaria intraflava]|nr:hypothetical protein F4861DRAFT_548191 [Xylaria intraflava]
MANRGDMDLAKQLQSEFSRAKPPKPPKRKGQRTTIQPQAPVSYHSQPYHQYEQTAPGRAGDLNRGQGGQNSLMPPSHSAGQMLPQRVPNSLPRKMLYSLFCLLNNLLIRMRLDNNTMNRNTAGLKPASNPLHRTIPSTATDRHNPHLKPPSIPHHVQAPSTVSAPHRVGVPQAQSVQKPSSNKMDKTPLDSQSMTLNTTPMLPEAEVDLLSTPVPDSVNVSLQRTVADSAWNPAKENVKHSAPDSQTSSASALGDLTGLVWSSNTSYTKPSNPSTKVVRNKHGNQVNVTSKANDAILSGFSPNSFGYKFVS